MSGTGHFGTRAAVAANAALAWSAAVILLGLLAGSAPVTIHGGKMEVGSDPGTVCAVQPERGMAAYGNVVRNGGDSPLIIRAVSLVDAKNLTIQSARIMPIQGSSPYVIGTGTTKPQDPEAQAAWRESKDVESYVIEPEDSVNVVVALDIGTQPSGTARALRIEYGQGAREFFVETNMTLTLADASCEQDLILQTIRHTGGRRVWGNDA